MTEDPSSAGCEGSSRVDLEDRAVVLDPESDHNSGSQDVGGGIACREGEEDDGSATDGSFVMVSHDSDDPADGDLDHEEKLDPLAEEDVGEEDANVASLAEGGSFEDPEGSGLEGVEGGLSGENGHGHVIGVDPVTDLVAEVVPVEADVQQEIEPTIAEVDEPKTVVEKANLVAEVGVLPTKVKVVMTESRDLAEGEVVSTDPVVAAIDTQDLPEPKAAVEGSSNLEAEEVVKEQLNTVVADADLLEEAQSIVQEEEEPNTAAEVDSLVEQEVASTESKVVPGEADLLQGTSETESPLQVSQESMSAPAYTSQVAEQESALAAIEVEQNACISVVDSVKEDQQVGISAVVSSKSDEESSVLVEEKPEAEPILVEEKPEPESIPVEEKPDIESIPVEEKPEAEPILVEEKPEAEPNVVEEKSEVKPTVVEEKPEAHPTLVKEKPEAEPVIAEEKPKVEPVIAEEKPEAKSVVVEEDPEAGPAFVEEKLEDESVVTKTIDSAELESTLNEDGNQQPDTEISAVADQEKVQERKEMDPFVSEGEVNKELKLAEIEENQEKASNTVLDTHEPVEPNLAFEIEEKALPCMDIVAVNGDEEIKTEGRKEAEAVLTDAFEAEGKQEPQTVVTSIKEHIEPDHVKEEEEKHPPVVKEKLNEHSDSMFRETVEHTEVEPVVHVELKQDPEIIASETAVVEEKREIDTDKSFDHLDDSEATAELSGESLELEVNDGECMVSPVESDPSAKKDDEDEPSSVEVEPSGEILTPLEEPSGSAIDGDKLESLKRQPCYIIRIPRFTDDELAKKLQHARVQLDQKTQSRDSIRVEIRKKKATHNEFREMLNAAKAEEEAARSVVTAKRKEIDLVLSMLNKMKSASAIDEINDKIHKLEHILQHESNTLSQEKQYIIDIKKLKQQRDQLSSNIGTQAEIEEAFERRDQIEERFKALKKELESLRSDQQRAENNVKSARKTCNDEFQLLKVLQEQFRVADDLRQEAYGHLQNIRKESSEKNKYFSMYKDDQQTALKYASSGEREGLQCHCSKQVEKIMELWNSNDEFRKQYINSNMNSTLRRLRTLDGRSLGPGEEPPILYSNVDRNSSNIYFPSTNISTPAPALVVEVKEETSDAQVVQMAQTGKSTKPLKSTPSRETIKATVPKKEVVEEVEVIKPTKEEEELERKQEILARKEEELRKEQAAAELKERCRIEQREKAREAEERKRRKAEKAQAKAEYKARKEAELREKKRAKKEKKVASADTTNEGTEGDSTAVANAAPHETAKELEHSVTTVTKRSNKPHTSIKQINKMQPLPLPLRNRAKRKTQKWLWVLFILFTIILVFLAGNYFSGLKLPSFNY